MRILIALFLSLILGIASQAEAVARSEMAGAVDQVLCGAQGASTVTLDAAGHVVHARSCTHCLAAGVSAALPGPATLPLAPIVRAERLSWTKVAQTQANPTGTPLARAPPAILG